VSAKETGASQNQKVMKAIAITVTVLACVSACGLFAPDASDDTATDAQVDVTHSDGPADAAIKDSSDQSDASEDETSISEAGPPHLHESCTENSQCDGGICCTTLTFETSNEQCLLDSIDMACATAPNCETAFQPFCGGDEIVRQCDYNVDCTESSYPVCCTFYFNTDFTTYQTGLRICASQFAADSADASCGP
jgi:hypothetical protein